LADSIKAFAFEDGHACGYYRLKLPFIQLAENGHDVATHMGWTEDARDYPVIVGQRVSRGAALPIWRRLRAGHKLVYETDDDVWTIDRTNVAAHLTFDPEVMDAVDHAIEVAHMVTVSTEPLAEVLRKRHPNVWVLPNHIDQAMLDIERPRRDRVVVGWAGGDSHLRDFAHVADELKRFLRRNPQVDFHNIGTSYLRPFKIPGRHTDWSADIWAYYRSIDFDVGIAPLADTVFNRSKSAIKAMEYAALGIPTIASDGEPYGAFVLDGVTGYLVRDEHEWGKRLYELVNDRAMREEMGRKAKEHVQQWTIQRGWHLWEAAYRSLL
jgi:glycosyltransferase involved in cell wall biosynthesis